MSSLRFLRREVEHEQAVRAGLEGLEAEALDAVGVDEVEVGVEDDGDLRLGAHGLENFEDARRGRAGLERALGGELVDDAVGEGIGKGDAELDDVGPGAFERPDQIGRGFGRRDRPR